MGNCQNDDLRVQFGRRLKLRSLGSKVTTDAGLLAFRELDEAFALTEMAQDRFEGSRLGSNTQHQLVPFPERIDANWRRSYDRIGRVLLHAVRASRVVECTNSVIRMHPTRHRTVTQPLLDLKRLLWNCRPLEKAKCRRGSPYEHLGLDLPSSDWWGLFQMDRKELAQKLST